MLENAHFQFFSRWVPIRKAYGRGHKLSATREAHDSSRESEKSREVDLIIINKDHQHFHDAKKAMYSKHDIITIMQRMKAIIDEWHTTRLDIWWWCMNNGTVNKRRTQKVVILKVFKWMSSSNEQVEESEHLYSVYIGLYYQRPFFHYITTHFP